MNRVVTPVPAIAFCRRIRLGRAGNVYVQSESDAQDVTGDTHGCEIHNCWKSRERQYDRSRSYLRPRLSQLGQHTARDKRETDSRQNPRGR